jgi:Fe-S-cluster containining protein
VRRTSRPSETALLDELAAIYREVDVLFAGWSCPSTTECCRFGLTGRAPYVTSIELSMVRRAIARRGGPLSPRKRALPLSGDAEREGICPLLDQRGRCSIYADRPLGCRTFHCSRATKGREASRKELGEMLARIVHLAARHQPGGDQGRLLPRAL